MLKKFHTLKVTRLTLAVVITVISTSSFAEPAFPVSKTFSVDKLVMAKALKCEHSQDEYNIIKPFYDNFYNTKNNFSNLNGKPYQFAGYTVTGANAISTNNYLQDDTIYTSRNFDVNINKYGVTVLRIASYYHQPRHDTGEGSGYYFVLKGSPAYNKKILQAKGMTSDIVILEATPANNTRLLCALAG